MALDQNLFTLQLNRLEDGSGLDLVDPAGVLHYRKRRLNGPHVFGVYEPLSDSLLAAIGSSSNNKAKVIELFNPNIIISMKYVGTLSFRWSFDWEDHTFEWKREQCFLIRKPDPPVLVAITREPPGKIQSTIVQILDYNLMRFDIMDRKGLEIVILTALLSFQDETGPAPRPTPAPQATVAASIPPAVPSKESVPVPQVLEPPPPKPSQPTQDDAIAILQAAESREANEVVVGDVGDPIKYAELCIKLLKDENILFVSIRSSSATAVPRVVAVADQTKRMAHRDDAFVEELHQYLSYQEEPSVKKQKKVIKLDDSANGGNKFPEEAYKPPESLIIRMSKIPMPELLPKPKPSSEPTTPTAPPPQSTSFFGKFGLRKKDEPKPEPTHVAKPANQLAPPHMPQRPASASPALGTKPAGSKLSKTSKGNNNSQNRIQTPPTHSRIPSSHSLPPQAQYQPAPPPAHHVTYHQTPPHMQQNWAPAQGPHPQPQNQPQPQQTPQPTTLTSLLGSAAYNMFTTRR